MKQDSRELDLLTDLCGDQPDKLSTLERWMSLQANETDAWILREILNYKCQSKAHASTDISSTVRDSNHTMTTNNNRSPGLIECMLQMYIVLKRENERLVEKSKEQLANARKEKSQEEQFNVIKEQLIIKDELIQDLKEDARLWKDKYLALVDSNQKLIEKTSIEQIESNDRLSSLDKANQNLQSALDKSEQENQLLQNENRRLNGELFKANAEVDTLKKNIHSADSLKKERLCCQQKVHLLAERLDHCKEKLDVCQAALKEKQVLVDLQSSQIKELNRTVVQLKSGYELAGQELERSRSSVEEWEKRSKEHERLYQDSLDKQRQNRSSEQELQRQTLHNMLSINAAYEAELLQLRAELSKRKYEQSFGAEENSSLATDNRFKSGKMDATTSTSVLSTATITNNKSTGPVVPIAITSQ